MVSQAEGIQQRARICRKPYQTTGMPAKRSLAAQQHLATQSLNQLFPEHNEAEKSTIKCRDAMNAMRGHGVASLASGDIPVSPPEMVHMICHDLYHT
mmetsp:Transcript_95668/g.164982  ORF Transcript_95668/g.164982 Transcript_95668/m.164982 type:complete len:97 (-) Transcript_95668:472-762(-)